MGSSSMSSTSMRLDPGLGLVLAFTLFASAIFTLASPNKGASHHGTHAQVHAMSGAAGSGAVANESGGSSSSADAVESLLASPRLEDASHVVMCVAMGFMLILML
jgi:hypothetical protein